MRVHRYSAMRPTRTERVQPRRSRWPPMDIAHGWLPSKPRMPHATRIWREDTKEQLTARDRARTGRAAVARRWRPQHGRRTLGLAGCGWLL